MTEVATGTASAEHAEKLFRPCDWGLMHFRMCLVRLCHPLKVDPLPVCRTCGSLSLSPPHRLSTVPRSCIGCNGGGGFVVGPSAAFGTPLVFSGRSISSGRRFWQTRGLLSRTCRPKSLAVLLLIVENVKRLATAAFSKAGRGATAAVAAIVAENGLPLNSANIPSRCCSTRALPVLPRHLQKERVNGVQWGRGWSSLGNDLEMEVVHVGAIPVQMIQDCH